MKKLLLILVPLVIVCIGGFFVYRLIAQGAQGKGALQVTAVPSSTVYLNGKSIGQTPLCRCDASTMVTSGDYQLKLVPQDSSFSPFEEKVTISPKVLTVVDWKFAPGGSSEGSTISLTPLDNQKNASLFVVSFPGRADVFLDSNKVGTTPLLMGGLTASDHIIKVVKEGYAEKDVRIRTPLGYKLSATVYLGIDDTFLASPSASPQASPSATPTPSVPEQTVKILDTPTGFLRVHSSASLGSSQIGEVNPGDVLPLLDEETGWFEIKMKDGTTGWISSDYAEKQGS